MCKKLLFLVLSSTLAFSWGCSSLNKPKLPSTLDYTSSSLFYTITAYEKDLVDYKAAYESGDQALAKRRRDAMIARIAEDIEAYYHEYEVLLYVQRAKIATVSDVTQLMLAAATAITKGERPKTVMASILSFLQGTGHSINENFFREKTTTAIIAQMRASRIRAWNEIVRKMAELSADQYEFHVAKKDLIDYFYKGALIEGIQTLTDEAGAAATKAKEEERKLNKELVHLAPLTPEERRQAEQLRDKFNKIVNDNDVAAAKAALKELGVDVKADATADEVFQMLNDQIGKAQEDKIQRSKVRKALKIQ